MGDITKDFRVSSVNAVIFINNGMNRLGALMGIKIGIYFYPVGDLVYIISYSDDNFLNQ